MKKYILAAGLAIICQTVLWGQDTDIENNAEVRAQIESIFEHLDKSRIPTGLLRDYSTDLVDYSIFDGTLNESNIANLTTYEYVLRSVRTSSVTSSYPFDSVLGIMDGMAEATTSSSIPISIAAFKYNYVADNSITDGLFQRVGDKVYDVYDSDQNWVSPYRESYVVAFAPSVETFKAGEYTFKADGFTYTNLNITSIELDAGYGYKSLDSDLTTFLSGGDIVLKLKITLDNGTVLYAHSKIYAEELTMHPMDQGLGPDDEELFSESVSGGTISATASIQYAPGHTSLVKPFIVVEGFDPVEFGVQDKTNPYYGKGRTTLKGILHQLSSRITNKYDIIYVDWNNSEADILDNAKLLIQIINWVNSQNSNSDGNVIMGQSMGGLITRYALCNMECNQISHKVVTFISHDVPYLGVNVPIGAQYAVTDLIKNVYYRHPLVNSFLDLGKVEYYVDLANKYLHSTSAQQMLLTYVNKDGELDTSEHLKWQATLKQIGFPKGDSNVPIRNIAIANGGRNDFQVDTLASFYGYSTLGGIQGFLISAFFGDAGGIFNSMLIGKSSNVTVDVNILPYNNSGCKVYSALVKYRKKLKWLGWKVSNTLYSRTKYAPFGTSNFGYDKVNGSYMESKDLSLDQLNNAVDVLDTTSFSVAKKFLFVPTASALCVGNDARALSAKDYYASYVSGINHDTPFANVYIDNSGKSFRHIKLDTLMCKWIDTNLNCKLEGPLCPKENDRYAVHNYTGTVEWATSDNNIATIDASGRIHIKKTGFVTIEAIFSGIRDTIRAMTGMPEFTLTSKKNIGMEGYEVKAQCNNSEILDFLTRTNIRANWGVKYGDEDIAWKDAGGLIFIPFGYSTFVNTGQKDAYVYFKPYNDAFVGSTKMVYCSKVPIKKPIEEPIIVVGDGRLLSSGETTTVETRSQGVGNSILYRIGDIDEFSFNHIPSATEFCRRLAESEKIKEMLKEMKPWGESESIIFKVTILTEKEEYDGMLKFIYKESI